jgi:hypothetical protein
MRGRHVVSVQADRPGPSPSGQSQRAKFVLSAGTKSLSECFRPGKRLELLERLKRLEQAPLVERLEPLEPWIEARRSNGKFFPIIADDSTGFEAS